MNDDFRARMTTQRALTVMILVCRRVSDLQLRITPTVGHTVAPWP